MRSEWASFAHPERIYENITYILGGDGLWVRNRQDAQYLNYL